MLLSFFLLFILCESTVKSLTTTTWPPTHLFTTEISITTNAVTVEEKLSPLQVVATPDYPVAAGQRVELYCSAYAMPDTVMWIWKHLQNKTWQEVGYSRDLTLTKPEQSGLYRCCAKSQLTQKNVTSPDHQVYIISMQATAAENLGVAAFFFSLLALIMNFAILFWLCWQRFGPTQTSSNTAAKGFPGPEKSSKGGVQQTEMDGDVYMNYTNTSQDYTDLDPSNATVDNVYSSLS
ncbi:uncharacterized protein LOC125900575 [Epinephelus fuscoguttatus]|uniref:uncharacterized protein LOC125900575 n=1 Tax=Epinephelus fuscoguttatus TaxID=293821 RepID=UPI0020D1A503|nr:uncharacterized protein LOC125900575 [Epinephelus fuscoguttatus]